jgi:hypothetical protein
MEEYITEKQNKLADLVVEQALVSKPMNKGEMLANVGYSQGMIKQPGRIIEGTGFKLALEKKTESMLEALEQTGVTPSFLARKVKELLNKEQVIVRNNVTTGLIETVETGEIDVQAVKIGMENAFKLGVGGGYKDNQTNTTNQTINYNFINSPEVQQKVKDFEDDLKIQLTAKPV